MGNNKIQRLVIFYYVITLFVVLSTTMCVNSYAQTNTSITDDMRRWIESTCSRKHSSNSPQYHDCLSGQIKYVLRHGDKIDWKTTNDSLKQSIAGSCENSKVLGPSFYFDCIAKEIDRNNSTPNNTSPQRPDSQNKVGDSKNILLEDKHPPSSNSASKWISVPIGHSAPKSTLIDPTEIFNRANKSIHLVVAGLSDSNTISEFDSLGTGIAITSSILITNAHIVEGKRFIYVKVNDKLYRADILSYDRISDRCALKVPTNLVPIQSFRLYNDLKIGEKVYAIGNPSGLEATFSEGIISGLRSNSNIKYIQTSAPISPGSSGGALLDKHGNLIGVTSFLLKDAQNLNFAISLSDFIDVSQENNGFNMAGSSSPAHVAPPSQNNAVSPEKLYIYKSKLRLIATSTPADKEGYLKIFDNYTPPGRPIENAAKALHFNKLGHDLLKQNNTKEASQNFELAYKLNSNNAEYSGNFGYTEYLLGNYVAAERLLVESLELSPKRASAWFTLGETYAFIGEQSLSAKCLRLACLTSRNIDKTKKFLDEKSQNSESQVMRNVSKLVLDEFQ